MIEDNARLAALFEEDRTDTTTFSGAEAFLSSQPRRALAQRMVSEGSVRTPRDYLHAARLLQHGERLEHWYQARELALKAAEMGEPGARYMAAAALDRWLMRQGLPQKYGTNTWPHTLGWRVWDYDPATTDEERAEWGVPPISELIARAEGLSGGKSSSDTADVPFVTVEYSGTHIGLYSWTPEAPSGTLPSYKPLPPHVPVPGWLPPEVVSLWRFGPLACGKVADDEVVVTWRMCRWRLVGKEVSEQELEQLSAAIGSGPIRLNEEGRVWSRVARNISPGSCWLVGGTLPWPDLERILRSL